MLVGTDPVHASAALAARSPRTTRSQLLPMRLERLPAHGRQVVSFGRVHGFSATGGAGWAAGKLARRWRRRTTASVAIMLLGVWWSRDGRYGGDCSDAARHCPEAASAPLARAGPEGSRSSPSAQAAACSCVARTRFSLTVWTVWRLVRRSDSDGAAARVELLREHCWLRPAWPSCTGRVASRSVRVTARRALTSEKNPILRRRVLVRA